MLQRSWPLLCTCALAGCGEGNSLEDFSRRTLRVQVDPIVGEGPYAFSARLEREVREVGCPRLRSGVKATLNGESLSLYRGGEPPDPDGPCGSPPVPPIFMGRGDGARFAAGPEDAVLEIRDGDERIVAHFRNLFARHGFARPATPLTVRPGQEVLLAWEPPTDDLSLYGHVALNDSRFTKATPEEGGLRVSFPANLPEGPVRVRALGFPRIPVVRCEGVAACAASIASAPQGTQDVEVLIQP